MDRLVGASKDQNTDKLIEMIKLKLLVRLLMVAPDHRREICLYFSINADADIV